MGFIDFHSKPHTSRPWRFLVPLLLVSWLLLMIDLEGKSLWTDELFTVEWARLSFKALIQRTAADVHPPLYFLLVRTWTRWSGFSDFALRWPSVAAAWLSIPLLYRLAKAWKGPRAAGMSAALWGMAPVVILYGRMARYYGLAACFGLLATVMLWQALTMDKKRCWIAYVVASSAAVYTFYLTALLLIAHGGLVLAFKSKRKLLSWLAAGALSALTLAPWIPIVLDQTVRTGQGAADLSFSVMGLLLKVGYTAYALALGESLFPWHMLAVAGGLAVLVLFVTGFLNWRKKGRGLLLPLLGMIALPVLGMILVTTLISPRTPFVSMPARAFFALPYAFLLFGGYAPSKSIVQRAVPFVVLVSWSMSLFNYYTDQHFLNPIYLTPAREIAAQVVSELQAGDVIYSPQDSGFYYYYDRMQARQPDFQDEAAALAAARTDAVKRVWVLTLGRDQTRENAPTELQTYLDTEYTLAQTWAYVPQDPIYRAIKSRLLHREAYDYRAVLSLYTR
ncbi:MAG: glycosyltransferase family 39 protein [Anaerolineae bacterium]|jgi:uncharacterized membrane protein|nr:glycosyltransferase family 39 protein [Anaerolineae bacterium]